MSDQGRAGEEEAVRIAQLTGMDRSALLVRVLEQESELAALRAAVLRYGRALQQIGGRDGSIVDAAGYDEWCAALEVLDALALALALATEEQR